MRSMLLRNDGIAAKGISVGLIRWTDGSSASPAMGGGGAAQLKISPMQFRVEMDWEASFDLDGTAAWGESTTERAMAAAT